MQFLQRPAIDYFAVYKTIRNTKQCGGSWCAFENDAVNGALTG